MATKKVTKKASGARTAKTTTAVAKPAKKAKATKTVIKPTNAPVITASKPDLTVTAEKQKALVCGVCKTKHTVKDGKSNFSMLKNGKYRNICKKCQTAASIAWTSKRADLRKEQAKARQYQNAGIPAIIPDAKSWKAGDPIMTVAYTDSKGVKHPAVNATELFESMKAERVQKREAEKAERVLLAEKAREIRAKERLEAKAKKDADKAALVAQRKADRDAKKAAKAVELAQKAEQAKKEREERAAAKAAERAQAAVLKADAVKAEKEKKAIERALANKKAAVDKATASADAKAQREADASEKALNALAQSR